MQVRVWLGLAWLCLVAAVFHGAQAADPAATFGPVECEGRYAKHLQGICTNDRDAIYWCFTDALVKTDLAGRRLKQVPVASHHGDLCYYDGKVYVAVNLGKFNRPAGQADSWVYVYDADTLDELSRHATPEVVHGAGGMAYHDGRLLVVGGLPEGIDENYLYEYDLQLKFLRRHTLASGYTKLGIQTAAYAQGHWWLGCYGSPSVLLKADADYQMAGKWNLNASVGIVGLPDGRLLVARSLHSSELGYGGRASLYVPDDELGLRPVEAAAAR